MKQISEITRRDIFDLFLYGTEMNEFFESKKIRYPFCGRLSEMDFLKRIYNLNVLPSYDNRFENAEGDIWQHTINNDDYEAGWVFEDDRFQLQNGEDEKLLIFLCAVFHPAVRVESGYWKEFLDEINGLLRNDGYELYPESKISGRVVYGWRKYNPEQAAVFTPFSQRNASEIKARKLSLSLNMKTRKQVFNILDKYTTTYRETSETGWQTDVTTSEYVFRDVSQFYPPKCYNESGDYVATTDMQKFIMNNSPFYVFDAIEFFEKYNGDNEFIMRINSVLKLNAISYKLENGKLVSTLDVSINSDVVSTISETGLKELVLEAVQYYSENNKEIAVEKIWDAFERLKTYYSPQLNKAKSAEKIIEDMSAFEPHYKAMYEQEFRTLTDIGNNFRIRHHETTKIDIADSRQYDYFYKRCLALLSVAIRYLEGGQK